MSNHITKILLILVGVILVTACAARISITPPLTAQVGILPTDELKPSQVALIWENPGMHSNQPESQQERVLPPYNVYEGTGNANGEASSTISAEIPKGNFHPGGGNPNYHASFREYASDFGWKLVPVNGMADSATALHQGQSSQVEGCGVCHSDKPVKSIWNFGSGN